MVPQTASTNVPTHISPLDSGTPDSNPQWVAVDLAATNVSDDAFPNVGKNDGDTSDDRDNNPNHDNPLNQSLDNPSDAKHAD
jgi:hypothetical protein